MAQVSSSIWSAWPCRSGRHAMGHDPDNDEDPAGDEQDGVGVSQGALRSGPNRVGVSQGVAKDIALSNAERSGRIVQVSNGAARARREQSI
jgi:hypothetical protein